MRGQARLDQTDGRLARSEMRGIIHLNTRDERTVAISRIDRGRQTPYAHIVADGKPEAANPDGP